jgi:hypothetical protein
MQSQTLLKTDANYGSRPTTLGVLAAILRPEFEGRRNPDVECQKSEQGSGKLVKCVLQVNH